jgi:hypothetical protein
MRANFFWRGNDYQFINRLTVESHLAVGHDVTIWLSGDPPNSKYWVDDLRVDIKDAADEFDVKPFLDSGGNFWTASAIWRFHYLHENGGLYCDMDHVALKSFPSDPWILSSDCEGRYICIGLIKAPQGHPVFLEAIGRIKKKWGNVPVFDRACKKYGLKITHEIEDFFPFPHYKKGTLFKDRPLPDSYSLHLFTKGLSKMNLTEEKIRLEYPNSMLERLVDFVHRAHDVNGDADHARYIL